MFTTRLTLKDTSDDPDSITLALWARFGTPPYPIWGLTVRVIGSSTSVKSPPRMWPDTWKLRNSQVWLSCAGTRHEGCIP